MRASIPPRWRINERTTPEWATTSAVGGSHSAAREATSPSAAETRSTTAANGSNDAGRWCASSHPGHRSSICSGVKPSHSPACASRSRASRIGAPRPSARAMIAAVSDARRRSLVQIAGNSSPSAANESAVAPACWRPSSVSGESAVPCQRRTEFHSLWPCRSTKIATRRRDIPTEGSADSTLEPMAVVRLFAAARDAAGTGRDELPGATVGDVLAAAGRRYGQRFTDVLGTCKIWVNGEPADLQDSVGAADELAVLPPVSGGATEGGRW